MIIAPEDLGSSRPTHTDRARNTTGEDVGVEELPAG